MVGIFHSDFNRWWSCIPFKLVSFACIRFLRYSYIQIILYWFSKFLTSYHTLYAGKLANRLKNEGVKVHNDAISFVEQICVYF